MHPAYKFIRKEKTLVKSIFTFPLFLFHVLCMWICYFGFLCMCLYKQLQPLTILSVREDRRCLRRCAELGTPYVQINDVHYVLVVNSIRKLMKPSRRTCQYISEYFLEHHCVVVQSITIAYPDKTTVKISLVS